MKEFELGSVPGEIMQIMTKESKVFVTFPGSFENIFQIKEEILEYVFVYMYVENITCLIY